MSGENDPVLQELKALRRECDKLSVYCVLIAFLSIVIMLLTLRSRGWL